MRTGWRKALSNLPRLEDPERIWRRVEEGPAGDGIPPTPGRGQRIAAAVVGLAVFAGAAVFALDAFGGGEPPASMDPDAAVITLAADVHPEASLAFGGGSAAVLFESYCWDQPNGAQFCGDVYPDQRFPDDGFLPVPQGTTFALVNDDGADPVALSLAEGEDPSASGLPITLSELGRTDPGRYVLTVAATWEQSAQPIVFHLALEIVSATSPEPPVDGLAVVSVQQEPLRVSISYGGEEQKADIRDTWNPLTDNIIDRPTCDDGTLGETLLVVPPSTRFFVEGDGLEGWTVFPQPHSDPTRLPRTEGPMEWTFRGESADLGFVACFSLFVRDPGVTVPVPDVIDLLDQGAYEALGEAGLLWDVALVDAPDEKQWRVLSTDPPIGAAVEPNTVVHVVLSTRIEPPPQIAIDGDEQLPVDWACGEADRVPFGGPHLRLSIGGEAWVTANLGGAEPGDKVVLAMMIQGSPPWDVWHWIRDGKVIAVVDYDSLDGVACQGSGVAGV